MIPIAKLNDDEIIDELTRAWHLTEVQREQLSRNMSVRHFKKNDIIYRELEEPSEVMCLTKGKVKVYKEGIGGRNPIIRAIKPVEFIGHRALFAEEKYKTSAMAFENSTVAVFPIATIKNLIKANYNVSMFFIKHLSRLLGISDERIVTLTQKHIRGRLADTILALKNSFGVAEDGNTLNVKMSREDLASFSNMSTSNAIRTLSSFANEKLIQTDGKKIKVMNEQELANISKAGMND